MTVHPTGRSAARKEISPGPDHLRLSRPAGGYRPPCADRSAPTWTPVAMWRALESEAGPREEAKAEHLAGRVRYRRTSKA
ncbi:hypothetical protein [Nonomuraea sp. NPDC005501]|uniref:hypothetical protein n=1 Tax=Nonomuraea sp. NPDC005501 TaxID=3156884 RepID=UPI00339DF791